MQPTFPRFSEPWQATALRTVSLALVAGAGVALRLRQVSAGIVVTLMALWFTLGGHFLELWFRNQLRQQISPQPAAQALARLVYWFAGGALLFEGAIATRALLASRLTIPFSWWMAGIGFVGVELLVHAGLLVRGQPSFYNGRG